MSSPFEGLSFTLLSHCNVLRLWRAQRCELFLKGIFLLSGLTKQLSAALAGKIFKKKKLVAEMSAGFRGVAELLHSFSSGRGGCGQ